MVCASSPILILTYYRPRSTHPEVGVNFRSSLLETSGGVGARRSKCRMDNGPLENPRNSPQSGFPSVVAILRQAFRCSAGRPAPYYEAFSMVSTGVPFIDVKSETQTTSNLIDSVIGPLPNTGRFNSRLGVFCSNWYVPIWVLHTCTCALYQTPLIRRETMIPNVNPSVRFRSSSLIERPPAPSP